MEEKISKEEVLKLIEASETPEFLQKRSTRYNAADRQPPTRMAMWAKVALSF